MFILDTSVTLGDISATTTALPRIEVRLVAILPHAAVALADAPLIVCYLAAPCVRPACYCSNPVTPQATRVPTRSTSRRGVWEAGRGFTCLPHPIHQSWWGESVVVNLGHFAPNHGRGCAADAPNAARARRRTCARHLCYGRTRVPRRGRPSSGTNRTDRALRTPRFLEPRSGHLCYERKTGRSNTSVTSHA